LNKHFNLFLTIKLFNLKDKTQKASELVTLQRENELVSQEKVKLEEEIFKKLQTKLTAEKAALYSDKLRKEQTDKIREIERNLAKVDNEIAKARLDILQTQTLNENLDRDVIMLKAEIEDKNRIISKSEIEIKKRVLLIEQKQGIMDLYNKKIEQMIEKAGVSGSTIAFITLFIILFYNSKGVELGPLELEEKNLTKEIEDIGSKIIDLEQKWLREQNELVKLIKDRENRNKEVQAKKQEFTVLTTKKMRIESNNYNFSFNLNFGFSNY
jgi:coiled-coil domain-containing protein 40